jgi:hypothetical protein
MNMRLRISTLVPEPCSAMCMLMPFVSMNRCLTPSMFEAWLLQASPASSRVGLSNVEIIDHQRAWHNNYQVRKNHAKTQRFTLDWDGVRHHTVACPSHDSCNRAYLISKLEISRTCCQVRHEMHTSRSNPRTNCCRPPGMQECIQNKQNVQICRVVQSVTAFIMDRFQCAARAPSYREWTVHTHGIP